MASFVVHGCKSANQKCAALVTAADEAGALAAARELGVNVEGGYAVATQVQASDLSTPDVAFYGDVIGLPGNGVWPNQDRAA